jgi:hypothetical protein
MKDLSSFFDSGPLPDWKDIQKWLGKDIPWNLVEKWDQGNDSAWLNQYVKDMMNKRAKPEAMLHGESVVRIDSEKDAKYVNVTIRLSPETDYRDLQLFATSERLKLIGLPDNKKRVIRFPCLVYAGTGTVRQKKNELQARFRRRPPEKSEYELFIRT